MGDARGVLSLKGEGSSGSSKEAALPLSPFWYNEAGFFFESLIPLDTKAEEHGLAFSNEEPECRKGCLKRDGRGMAAGLLCLASIVSNLDTRGPNLDGRECKRTTDLFRSSPLSLMTICSIESMLRRGTRNGAGRMSLSAARVGSWEMSPGNTSSPMIVYAKLTGGTLNDKTMGKRRVNQKSMCLKMYRGNKNAEPIQAGQRTEKGKRREKRHGSNTWRTKSTTQ